MTQKHIEIPSHIQNLIKQQNKLYGKKSKPRNLEPSMAELLTWDDTENLKQDYKKNIQHSSTLNKYQMKIKKSSSPWISEKQQNYQPYIKYNQNDLLFAVDLKTLDKLRATTNQKKLTVIKNQLIQNQDFYSDLKGNKSLTQNDYAIKRVKSEDELYKLLQENQVKKPFKHKQFQNILYLNSEGDMPQKKSESPPLKKQLKSTSHKGQQNKIQRKKKKLNNKVIIIDPLVQSPQLKERQKKIKKFHQTTRWIPNTSFTTYYGKPAFQNYGRGNTKPLIGGLIYGQYLLTHNINPHRGNISPKYLQTYSRALAAGQNIGQIYPEPPRLRPQQQMCQQQIQFKKKLNPIFAKDNKFEGLKIHKPDLINSYIFSQNPNKALSKEVLPKFQKISKVDRDKKIKQKQKGINQNKTYNKIKQNNKKNFNKQQIKTNNKLKPSDTFEQPKNKYKKSKSPKQPQPNRDLSFFPGRTTDFYSEVLMKKQKANRLALKVNQVVFKKQAQATKKNQKKQENIDIKQEKVLDQLYLDPKNYKNVPSVWLQRIPFAGKSLQRNYTVKQLLI